MRRIAASNSRGQVHQPTPGTDGDNESDSNADTCCLGQNYVVLQFTQRMAEVFAFDENLPSNTVPIVSGATAYTCPRTRVTYILVIHEALYFGTKLNHSLLNPNQIRMHGIPLWDNAFDPNHPELGINLGDLFIPFKAKGTKLLFSTRAPTEKELQECPHIHLTSRVPWEPSKVQLQETNVDVGHDDLEDPRSNEYELAALDPLLDPLQWRQVSQVQAYDRRSLDVPTRATFASSERHPRVTPEELSERWGISVERARATLKATLQRGTRSAILPLARRYVADRMYDRPRLKGKFSTDTAYFHCKSLKGNIASQIYFHKCGFYSNYNIDRVNDEKIGPTLPRFISEYGIPEHLTMDGAGVQVGRHTKFMETIRRANIDYHISKPYRPDENPAEGGIRELKRRFYRLVIKHGIPMRVWDFVLDYVVDIMNVTVNYSKYSDGRVPLEIITGITPEITEYLDFTIWGWVHFRSDGGLGITEIGKWLGVSHRVGPMMTYWVLPKSGIPISTDTVQAITEAELQTDVVKRKIKQWEDGTAHVFEAKTVDVTWDLDEVRQENIFDYENEDEEFHRNFSATIDADTFEEARLKQQEIMELEGELEGLETGDLQEPAPQVDDITAPSYVGMEIGLRRGGEGELLRATVKRRALDVDGRPTGVATNNPLTDTRKYEVEYDDGTIEVLSANLLAENLLEQVDEHGHKHRMMEEIGGHRKLDDAVPIEDAFYETAQGNKRRRMTTRGWELYVTWKDGSSNFIPLREMKEFFPIETAMYARDHGLADQPAFVWWVDQVLKKKQRFMKKVKSKYWERTHKYGIRIPKTIQEAIEIDNLNGNKLWQEAIQEEMANNRVAFEEYTGDVKDLVGYKQITAHMVFDVKLGENFRRKARYVADGHKTAAPAALTYSTVVSRDSVRILLMIAALNGLDLQSADIQNAFLTAPNLERCYMIAGPEFLEHERGRVFIVKRALYGLKSAAQAFRSFLAQHIEDLGFFQSEADPDVWLRPAVKPDGQEYYEYVLCYVDDILCISADAMSVMQQLQKKFKFKKDLIEEPTNYLGAKVKKMELDGHMIWTISAYDYVKAAVANVETTLKEKPKWKLPGGAVTPMVTSYEPELDGSPELNEDDHRYYQELIGILRWATELGRVDILHEVSLLSQYQACPREGHMEQVLRIFAYLKVVDKLKLYMDHQFPDFSRKLMKSSREEFQMMYRGAKEELPARMPLPRGRIVEITAYVDASYATNKVTRKSHTGYIIFVNKAPVLWYSKKQNTVEGSTFGAEYIALKTCIEAIVSLRFKLRMFGIPIVEEPANVFCDNESVVKNSTKVESVLNKKHNSVAYHYVRWNVAAGVIQVSWISTDDNLADLFTKRLSAERRTYLLYGFTY